MEILKDEKPDIKFEIKEIKDFSSIYYELYSKNASLLNYNRLHVSIMYNFFRRKGQFLKRYFSFSTILRVYLLDKKIYYRVNMYQIQYEIINIEGMPTKKQKDEKSKANQAIFKELNEISVKFKAVLFATFNNLENLQNNNIDSLFLVKEY